MDKEETPCAFCKLKKMDADTYNFIVAAVNACKRINPDNPLAVAENMEALVKYSACLLGVVEDYRDEGPAGEEYPSPELHDARSGVEVSLAKIKGENI